MKIPESLIEAAAIADLSPTKENVRALLDELGKLIVRELVSKAIAEILVAKLEEGPQAGGLVGTPWPKKCAWPEGTFDAHPERRN